MFLLNTNTFESVRKDDSEICCRVHSRLCCDRSNRTCRHLYGTRAHPSAEQRKRQAALGLFTAFCVAIGFVFLGQIIFDALGITDADFQVAGGLILLALAGRELLNVGPASPDCSHEFGIVPLGMPLIAGPALLTALLVLVDTVGIGFTLASLLANLVLVALAFWNADRFAQWMGMRSRAGPQSGELMR